MHAGQHVRGNDWLLRCRWRRSDCGSRDAALNANLSSRFSACDVYQVLAGVFYWACCVYLQASVPVLVQPVAGLGASVQTGRVAPSEGRRARHARQAPPLLVGHLAVIGRSNWHREWEFGQSACARCTFTSKFACLRARVRAALTGRFA